MALTLDEQTFLIAMLQEAFNRAPAQSAQKLVGQVLNSNQQEALYDFLKASRDTAIDEQLAKVQANKDAIPPRVVDP